MITIKKDNKKLKLVKDIPLTSMGWELAMPIFIGALIGHQIDQHTSSSYTFTMICLVLGIIAGYYSLYKHIALELLRNKAARVEKQRQDRTTS